MSQELLKKDLNKILKLLEDKRIERDNDKIDLRDNLMNELPRGTLTSFRKAEFQDYIVYFSENRDYGIFYDRESLDFLFTKGSLWE